MSGKAGARINLIVAMREAASDRIARAALSAHRRLRLHEPSVDEIAGYRNGRSRLSIRAQAGIKSAEALLSLRNNALTFGPLKKERRAFQNECERLLRQSVEPDMKIRKEYGDLAKRFSRLLATHYVDGNGMRPEKIDVRLTQALPALAGHLLAELEIGKEARFVNLSKSLCKFSVFDIDEKLDVLLHHPHKVVRDNARTIIYVGLNNGDFSLVDALARNANEKLMMLGSHPDAIVRDDRLIIIDAALRNGHLEVADHLAKGANAKLEMLQHHPEAIVRDNARTILCAALRRADLQVADTLAKGAGKAYAELRNRLGKEAKDLRTRFSQMMNMATLDVDRYLKKMTFNPPRP